ncbi:hypothetical protein HanIR_Chr16g0804041 [Helianthus annuus]|nr:hypothetical protein HanIR_Chr16g0804041 [Helianthus annuus]
MFSLWFVFVYLMADVMPRGHGETELGIHQIRILFGEGRTRLTRFPQGKLGGKPKIKSFAGWSKRGECFGDRFLSI